MLSEKIRNCDFNWEDAKTKLKKDHRWDQVADYDRDEMERLFSSHMGTGFEKSQNRTCSISRIRSVKRFLSNIFQNQFCR